VAADLQSAWQVFDPSIPEFLTRARATDAGGERLLLCHQEISSKNGKSMSLCASRNGGKN
jgi:hypothetical protein